MEQHIQSSQTSSATQQNNTHTVNNDHTSTQQSVSSTRQQAPPSNIPQVPYGFFYPPHGSANTAAAFHPYFPAGIYATPELMHQFFQQQQQQQATAMMSNSSNPPSAASSVQNLQNYAAIYPPNFIPYCYQLGSAVPHSAGSTASAHSTNGFAASTPGISPGVGSGFEAAALNALLPPKIKKPRGPRPPRPKTPSKREQQEALKVGDVVWAKVGHHPHWPGQIADPEGKQSTRSMKMSKPGSLLIHFFGTLDYAYVLPTHLLPWEPYYAAKSTKSKSKLFLLACSQAQAFAETQTAPAGWEDDNFDERHATSFRDAFEESAVVGPQTETLIVEHDPDFQPLRQMQRDNSTAAKKRRERRLKALRQLALVPPE